MIRGVSLGIVLLLLVISVTLWIAHINTISEPCAINFSFGLLISLYVFSVSSLVTSIVTLVLVCVKIRSGDNKRLKVFILLALS